jgi:hypothetical protein
VEAAGCRQRDRPNPGVRGDVVVVGGQPCVLALMSSFGRVCSERVLYLSRGLLVGGPHELCVGS